MLMFACSRVQDMVDGVERDIKLKVCGNIDPGLDFNRFEPREGCLPPPNWCPIHSQYHRYH